MPLRGLKLCRHCTGHHVCEVTRNEGHTGHERNVRLKDDDGDEVLDLMLCNEDGLHANKGDSGGTVTKTHQGTSYETPPN
jgi:hypothetical protein